MFGQFQRDVRMGHLFGGRFPPANATARNMSDLPPFNHGSAERRRRREDRERSPARHEDRQRDDAQGRRVQSRVGFVTGPVTSDTWQDQIDGINQRLAALDRVQRDHALTIGRLREHAQSNADGVNLAS